MVGPAMFYAEVTSVLREHVFWGKILPEEGEEALSICLDIPVRTVDNPEVYRRAWELARRFNLPRTYDMQYLAVAELEDCEFWTADRKLANSLRNKVKRIRWVGDHGK
jgi:predicted nucleic acid-binding protein